MDENKKKFWLKYEELKTEKEQIEFINSIPKIKFLSEKQKVKTINELLQDYKEFKDRVFFY